MKIQYQDLNTTSEKIKKHFNAHKEASLSAIFRSIRKLKTTSFFGDYSILAHIILIASAESIYFKKNKIKRAISYAPELKGQRQLLNQLFKLQMTLLKDSKMPNKTINLVKRSFIAESKKNI